MAGSFKLHINYGNGPLLGKLIRICHEIQQVSTVIGEPCFFINLFMQLQTAITLQREVTVGINTSIKAVYPRMWFVINRIVIFNNEHERAFAAILTTSTQRLIINPEC